MEKAASIVYSRPIEVVLECIEHLLSRRESFAQHATVAFPSFRETPRLRIT
ncbi:MAG: hypothetical protein JWQ49_6176 [Edaphobacter sp.]|nr:hypothetical protein [Edaphobacter sp.]